MKKLLFILMLAAVCTVTTSSFKPAKSANDQANQATSVALVHTVKSVDEGKKDDKKKKQAPANSCCQAKTQKAECTPVQQKSCPAAKVNCPEVKECEKK